MNKVTETLNKINKSKALDLKAEKIELGLVDDLKDESRKATDSGAEVGAVLNRLNADIAKAKAMIKASLKYQANVGSVGKRLEVAYKELGLDIPSEISKRITGAKQWENELEGFLKQLEKVSIK